MRRPVLKWCGAAVLGSFIVHCSKRRTLSMLEMGGGSSNQYLLSIYYLKRKYIQELTVDRRHKISSLVGNNALKTRLDVKSQPQDRDRELTGHRELAITAANGTYVRTRRLILYIGLLLSTPLYHLYCD